MEKKNVFKSPNRRGAKLSEESENQYKTDIFMFNRFLRLEEGCDNMRMEVF